MKRNYKVYLVVLAFLGVLLLNGCQCKHEWIPADCTTPKTCSKCGETEGEPLGHDSVTDALIEATLNKGGMTEGAHCARCGEILVSQEETPSKLDALAEEVMTNPEEVSGSRYTKWYEVSSFAEKEDFDSYWYDIKERFSVVIVYDVVIGDLEFSIVDDGPNASRILSVYINRGVPANTYKYEYCYYMHYYLSEYGFNETVEWTDWISGKFVASSLSKATEFTYSKYNDDSGLFYLKDEDYKSEDYKKEAAAYTKQLIRFIDKLFITKDLSIRMSDFNFN